MLAAEVYAKGLSHLGHGRPLWIPEPPDGVEILIGDVGYFLGGRFYRLFNVTRSRDDTVNARGVPANFEVLDLELQPLHSVDELFPPKASICSLNVTATDVTAEIAASAELLNVGGGASYRFTCGTEQGALLLLKDRATSQEVHPSSRLFIDCMRMHYRNWCTFALDKYKLELKPEEIVFVRGWVKTTEWAVAAFLQNGSGQELSLQAEGASLAKARFSVSNSQHHSTSVLHRTGPRRNEESVSESSPPRDQCIFLSYFKLKRSLFGFKIVAAAEPQADDDPRSSPEPDSSSSYDRELDRTSPTPDSDYSVHAYPEHVPSWDPLDDVLDYILETSGMDLAITSHCSLRQLQWPHDNDIKSTLKQLRPPLTVLDSQVGILEAEFSLLILPSQTSNASPEASTAPDDTSPELMGGVIKQEVVQKPGCQRCRGLKVRCEFKADRDICQRCFKGGHECVIPGRKKHPALSKHELLLSQIRDQADRINELMAELEEANLQSTPSEDTHRTHRAPSSQSSATLVGSAESVSYLSSYDDSAPLKSVEPSSYVRDWLAKGRRAMTEFDEYIHSAERSLEPPELHQVNDGINDLSDLDYDWEDAMPQSHSDRVSVISDDEAELDGIDEPLVVEDTRRFHSATMSARQPLNRADLDSILHSRKSWSSRIVPPPPPAGYFPFSLPKLQSPQIGAKQELLSGGSSVVKEGGPTSSPGLFSSPFAHPSSQAVYQHQSHFDLAPDTFDAHAPKRSRGPGPDELDAGAGNPSKATEAVKRPACQRCKGLKVKCDFRTDPDICKRCLKGGHDCIITGRTKRRAPPKREHLLSQIREQADRINKLMTELQRANRGGSGGLHASSSQSLPAGSTAGPSTSVPSHLPNASEHPSSQDTPSANVVEDWLAKAQQSMNIFGGFLETGRSGAVTGDAALVTVTEEDEHSTDHDSASNGESPATMEVDEEDIGEGLPTTSLERRKRSRSDSPTFHSRLTKQVLMPPPEFIPSRTPVTREDPLDNVSDRLSQPSTSSGVGHQPSSSADCHEPDHDASRLDMSSLLDTKAPSSRRANSSQDDGDEPM